MPDDTFRWVVAGGVAIATLSMFVMAVMMIVLYRVLTRLQIKVDTIADRSVPVIDAVRHLVNENSPKIGDIVTSVQQTAGNTRDISVIARDQAHRFAEVGHDISVIAQDQAHRFAEVGRDITDRARVQVARVDAAVDETVEQVQHLGSNVKSAVMKPVSEVSGVLAGIRAGVATYAQGQRPDVARVTLDEEMFI